MSIAVHSCRSVIPPFTRAFYAVKERHMPRQDRVRAKRLRIAVRTLIERDQLSRGGQVRLAEYFGVSRQFVHQIVCQERLRANPAIRAQGALPREF
jgi:hypothetical protein